MQWIQTIQPTTEPSRGENKNKKATRQHQYSRTVATVMVGIDKIEGLNGG